MKTRRATDPALAQKRNGSWEVLTWSAYGEKVGRLSSALEKAGFRPGEKIAVFAENCPEWLIADYAILNAGMVSVPLYPNQTEEQVRYILEHSEASAIFVRGVERLKKLRGITSLKKIIAIGPTEGQAAVVAAPVQDFQDFLATGETSSTGPGHGQASRADRIVGNSLATIVYTSGTTAQPKGVLLTHDNLVSEAWMINQRTIRTHEDIVLSYLPLSHVAERLNQLRQAVKGYSIWFGQGLDTLAQDLREVRPTSFMGVPRVYEKFQEAILAGISQAEPRRRALFERTLEVGRDYLKFRQEGRSSVPLSVRSWLLKRLVGKKVRAKLGLDRCKNYFSGAAPIGMDTLTFFDALGMPIVEVYGLTECAGATHYNFVDNPVYGTVGPHLEGMKCKIAADGEILLRGANIFAGYHKDPEATREAFDNEGWFCTGDIGVVDEKGCLRITDRKKSIIVTAAGKNIAPGPLEFKIKQLPLVSQAVVIGDRRKHLAALVTLAVGQKPCDEVELAIAAHIENINATLPSYETIKKFTILPVDFSVEAGELTPTLKAKRNVIQEKYKAVIDAMYGVSTYTPRPTAEMGANP
ncbi:MAG TPA: long-chain fatty acid--CoA ligase [Bdellovibrionota bacterium]|nr:long-chain fatty acid--CoA ligase [Bdellovibrionota bacterium]